MNVDIPVKVWQEDDVWYAEGVTVPQAHVNGSSREEVVAALKDVLRDLDHHGLLTETAELATIHA